MNWRTTTGSNKTPMRLAAALPVLAALLAPGLTTAQESTQHPCGNPFSNHYGPFDYRTAPAQQKNLVESVHFTPGVESMVQPATTMKDEMAKDVAYTLRVFPNHPRALLTMQRLSEKHKVDPPPGSGLTIECWFDRAIRYAPNDTVARALFAQYLVKRNRKDEALRQLEAATNYAKDNPISHYNIGLVYFEMAEFDRALVQAHKAQELGYQRPELAERLKRANKWSEPSSEKQ